MKLKTDRKLVRFCEVMPKGLERVVGPFVIGVTDKQNNGKDEVDPTKGIHKSFNDQPVFLKATTSSACRAFATRRRLSSE